MWSGKNKSPVVVIDRDVNDPKRVLPVECNNSKLIKIGTVSTELRFPNDSHTIRCHIPFKVKGETIGWSLDITFADNATHLSEVKLNDSDLDNIHPEEVHEEEVHAEEVHYSHYRMNGHKLAKDNELWFTVTVLVGRPIMKLTFHD